MMEHKKFFIGTFRTNELLTPEAKPEGPAAQKRRSVAAGGQVPQAFKAVCAMYREERDSDFEHKSAASASLSRRTAGGREQRSFSEADEFVDLEHKAVVGVPETVTALMENIQSFIDRRRLHDTPLPEYYRGLPEYAPEEQRKYDEITHAVFHELYGFKALACWMKYPNSYAAQVIGTSIWIHTGERHECMPFQFSSEREVEKLIRSLTRQKDDAVVNLYRTALEVDLYTGERVTLTIKPDVKHDVITLRRFLIDRIIVEELAHPKRSTLPPEAVPIVRGIAKTHCNTLIVGPPGTGKSTTLKAMLAERADHYTGAIIEKHYELAASRDFPEKKLIERVTHESTFHHAMDQVLRFDVDYAVIGEIRRVEAEGAMLACERLYKGFASTYHTWKPETIPSQLARLLCNLNTGARFEEEEKRVAENIDIVIVQKQEPGSSRKRIVSIMELQYDRHTGEISTHEIMRWCAAEGRWQYRMAVSSRLLAEMESIEPEWTERVVRALKANEQLAPIPKGEGVTVYNPADKNPLYRVEQQLQRMNQQLAELTVTVAEQSGG